MTIGSNSLFELKAGNIKFIQKISHVNVLKFRSSYFSYDKVINVEDFLKPVLIAIAGEPILTI